MKFKEALTYDDVLLVPQYSDIESRKEINISNDLGKNIHLGFPIISAPMDSVTGLEMAYALGSKDGLGVVHRYMTIEGQATLIKELHSSLPVGKLFSINIAAAVGVRGDYFERAMELVNNGANILCVDVAHGHHILVKKAIDTIKSKFDDIHIMAGNVATKEGYIALSRWGADSVRCNVGGGSICSTRVQTGHGIPGLHTVFDCAAAKEGNAKIIADGGIRTSGDIVKALAAGADFVMLGSMLAGTKESPGFIIEKKDGTAYKLYRGMASKDAQMDWRGQYSSNEGISTTIPYKGPVDAVLEDLFGGIRSGLSYSGVRNIKELQENAIFTRQTTAGRVESGTHILRKM